MTEFIQRHIGITETEQTQMLKDLGLSSLEELVREVVPTSILLRGDDNLPEPCSEQQALEELKEIAEHNIVRRSLIGQGYTNEQLDTMLYGTSEQSLAAITLLNTNEENNEENI